LRKCLYFEEHNFFGCDWAAKWNKCFVAIWMTSGFTFSQLRNRTPEYPDLITKIISLIKTENRRLIEYGNYLPLFASGSRGA
jgi:hypothetical protein